MLRHSDDGNGGSALRSTAGGVGTSEIRTKKRTCASESPGATVALKRCHLGGGPEMEIGSLHIAPRAPNPVASVSATGGSAAPPATHRVLLRGSYPSAATGP